MPSKLINLVGKKFGELKVLKHDDKILKTKHGSTVHRWFCQCDCGKTVLVRGDCLTRGSTKTCGCGRKRTGQNNKCWLGYGEISASFWKQFKWSAKNRKLSFKIGIKDAWDLYLKQDKKCALSGIPLSFPKNARDTSHNASLDRIDSNKGYEIDNIQWVDKRINYMKTTLKNEEFINLCKLVAEKQKSKDVVEAEVAV